jgi:CBS domain-containing protein
LKEDPLKERAKKKRAKDNREGKRLSDTYKGSSDSGFPSDQAEDRFDSCLWMTVKELYSTELVTVQENTSLEEILSLFGKHAYHVFPVVNKKNELVGIIDLDIILETLLLCFMPREKYTYLTAVRSFATKAKEVMVTHPVTISLNTTLKDASNLMMKYKLDNVCVIDKGNLVGVLSKIDIIKEISKRRNESVKE